MTRSLKINRIPHKKNPKQLHKENIYLTKDSGEMSAEVNAKLLFFVIIHITTKIL
jgi:hypothetical protein